ncbi:MAG: DNA polymerase III subunit delta' [Clostridia bacterium]|nr:DNA polymerase III subunit delta' [Clostridia bacterium]
MAEYENVILNNLQFLEIMREDLVGNSFLFETQDEVLLENFSKSFAKFLLCSGKIKPCNECISCLKMDKDAHSDVRIYPKNNKNVLVDDVKDLIENIFLKPIESDKNIFIFNEFSSANLQAQNKLLKILEEPPKNSYIILNVTNPSKILPTIMSRCKKVRLKPLSKGEMLSAFQNKEISKLENAVEIAQGSLQKAELFLNDDVFLQTFKNCLNTILELKDSRYLLKFSSKLRAEKDNILLVLEIFESLFRDLLLIKLDKESLVKNKLHLKELLSVCEEYDGDSLDKIIRKIFETKKILESNCNADMLIDSLLLYILEVKYLCRR